MLINTERKNMDLGLAVERNAKWHHEKDIVDGGREDAQILKLQEEVLELCEALEEGFDDDECKKEAGDVLTVIINLLERRHWTVQECLELTNEKLSKRTGKKINGTFVKSEDL